jgi:hypothetical protein
VSYRVRVPDETWDGLREQLAADLRRVADRLRSMSETRLAGQPAPPERGGAPYHSRAGAARAVAGTLADTAGALEAAASGTAYPGSAVIPELGDLAAADQLQVTGNDLLAALDLVAPDLEVTFGDLHPGPARDGVARAARELADLRRRL